ncbi:hypothetical protein [Aequorivita echinoideorum]|uniref:Dolichyl-phosphate-mannose-protein mannosyltransferase n=1 Tax=Aequorivita echinoideorum TaxID=1549647 RepID=A0ABS5S6L2_9FLAO|nr:hypothetical protein [Aequorivita echinoideorum]MBT0608846.1 hypothetical protein [Aequorivita echinoideorum]
MKRIWEKAKKNPYTFLFITGIAARLAIYLAYGGHVSMFNDSENYTDVAEMIKNWDFSSYNGNRTPGYPFLIFLANISGSLVTIYQSILGILTSLMLYSIFYNQSKNVGISLIAGLVPSIFLHLLFYERAILTENLTLFCFTACIWFMIKKDFFNRPQKLFAVFLIGILSMVTVTVRPMFLILPLFITIYYILLNYKEGIFHNAIRVFLFCTPFLIFYTFWTSFNESHTGYKSITSFSGGNLAQNTVFYVEKADDKYAEIRDIHVRKRDSLIAHNHDPAMAIWFVFTEMKKKDSLTVAEFSQRLNPMNRDLIMENKLDYLKQVSTSWADFWGTSILWNYNSFKIFEARKILLVLWKYITFPVIIILKILFLLICGYHIFIRIMKRRWLFNFELFCVLLILGASIGQALVTFGSNARFSMPFFPLMVIVVLQFYLNFNKKICHNQY